MATGTTVAARAALLIALRHWHLHPALVAAEPAGMPVYPTELEYARWLDRQGMAVLVSVGDKAYLLQPATE